MATVVLVCAVFAATAAGVLVAYGICLVMFAIFRIHAGKIAVRSTSAVVMEPRPAEV